MKPSSFPINKQKRFLTVLMTLWQLLLTAALYIISVCMKRVNAMPFYNSPNRRVYCHWFKQNREIQHKDLGDRKLFSGYSLFI